MEQEEKIIIKTDVIDEKNSSKKDKENPSKNSNKEISSYFLNKNSEEKNVIRQNDLENLYDFGLNSEIQKINIVRDIRNEEEKEKKEEKEGKQVIENRRIQEEDELKEKEENEEDKKEGNEIIEREKKEKFKGFSPIRKSKSSNSGFLSCK